MLAGLIANKATTADPILIHSLTGEMQMAPTLSHTFTYFVVKISQGDGTFVKSLWTFCSLSKLLNKWSRWKNWSSLLDEWQKSCHLDFSNYHIFRIIWMTTRIYKKGCKAMPLSTSFNIFKFTVCCHLNKASLQNI